MSSLRAEEILRWVKGPKVLDVGCTSHQIAIDSPRWLHGRILKKFRDAVGIDISGENIELLRKAGFSNLHVQSAESFDLREKFDTIVAGELIEHLANPGLFLKQARKHLRDGGNIVLTTPNPFSIAYFLYAFLKFPRTCHNLEHTCWFCPRTLVELAERSGFRVSHFELIDDYDSDSSTFVYRQFGNMMTFFGGLIPKRLKKTMLFVLETNGDFAHR